MLCLVAGRPAVAVAAPVWQAIVEAGRHAPGPDPLAGIGLPRPPEGTDAPWVIAAGSRSVDVDGGSWGAGRLTCSGRGVWRWQPLPRFSINQGRSAENRTAGQTSALRLRAVVNLPRAEASRLEISKSRRTLLEQQLPYSAVAGAVTMLSRRRGAELSAARRKRGPFGNSDRSAAYSCTIAGPDGGPALKASVMLALPATMESTVVACSDVPVENPQAWAAALGSGRGTRLGGVQGEGSIQSLVRRRLRQRHLRPVAGQVTRGRGQVCTRGVHVCEVVRSGDGVPAGVRQVAGPGPAGSAREGAPKATGPSSGCWAVPSKRNSYYTPRTVEALVRWVVGTFDEVDVLVPGYQATHVLTGAGTVPADAVRRTQRAIGQRRRPAARSLTAADHAGGEDEVVHPFPPVPYATAPELFASLREHRPVCPVRMPSGHRVHMLTRRDDIRAALIDPRFSRNLTQEIAPRITGDDFTHTPGALFDLDPPDHTRVHRVLTPSTHAPRSNATAPRSVNTDTGS